MINKRKKENEHEVQASNDDTSHIGVGVALGVMMKITQHQDWYFYQCE